MEEHRPWWPRIRNRFNPFELTTKWTQLFGYSDRIEIEDEEEPESRQSAAPETQRKDGK